MERKNWLILTALAAAGILLASAIFFKGEGEDSWICNDGVWIKHGNPAADMPQIPCPGDSPTPGVSVEWKTQNSPEATFQYPEKLLTKYAEVTDWPPKLKVSDQQYSCATTGDETTREGITEIRRVDDREYCVTRKTGAAAGTMYIQYTYTNKIGNRTVTLTFGIRFPTCANFETVQQLECSSERGALDVDSLADKMLQTLRVN